MLQPASILQILDSETCTLNTSPDMARITEHDAVDEGHSDQWVMIGKQDVKSWICEIGLDVPQASPFRHASRTGPGMTQ